MDGYSACVHSGCHETAFFIKWPLVVDMALGPDTVKMSDGSMPLSFSPLRCGSCGEIIDNVKVNPTTDPPGASAFSPT